MSDVSWVYICSLSHCVNAIRRSVNSLRTALGMCSANTGPRATFDFAARIKSVGRRLALLTAAFFSNGPMKEGLGGARRRGRWGWGGGGGMEGGGRRREG